MSSHHSLYINRSGLFGYSEWQVRLGRLVRPMGRSTRLCSEPELRRWVKRYPDVHPSDVERAQAFLRDQAGTISK